MGGGGGRDLLLDPERRCRRPVRHWPATVVVLVVVTIVCQRQLFTPTWPEAVDGLPTKSLPPQLYLQHFGRKRPASINSMGQRRRLRANSCKGWAVAQLSLDALLGHL